MENSETINLAAQLNLAQDLLIKFFNETATLIKEVEGQLKRLPEEFVMLQTTGYGVITIGSAGIEFPDLWLSPYFGVVFAPSKFVEKDKRGTKTKQQPPLKVVFMKIVLRDDNIKEPEMWLGVLNDIEFHASYAKFEKVLSHLFYSLIKYEKKWQDKRGPFVIESTESKWLKFKGKLIRLDLLSLTNSEDVSNKIIKAVSNLS